MFILILFFSENYWQNPENQKEFFVSFARDNGFDPLTPEPWYQISRSDLLARKVQNIYIKK